MKVLHAKLGAKHGRVPKLFRLSRASVFIIAVVAVVLSATDGHAEKKISTITIHAKRYQFVPAEITLTVGKPVRLVFIADDIAHGIAVDGLLSDLNINPGQPTVVVITPSKIGDFAGRCSRYCGVGHERMKFLVHVVE